MRWLIPVTLFVILAVVGYAEFGLRDRLEPDLGTEVTVNALDVSPTIEAGRLAYDRRCADCHGLRGGGSPDGPPLVHPIYRRAHHADVAFSLAVQRGVRAHHWRFGDMPPQGDIGSADVAAITRYIRELQAANGIK